MIMGLVAMAAACGQQASSPSDRHLAKSGSGTPLAVVARHSAADPVGFVQGSASGDVKSGPGDLEIFNVRMDRQTISGASILRQYANPGGEYAIKEGETIELWAEYRGANNPRLLVNWGDGQSDFINCGSCLMKHTYSQAGRFTVKVTLDDRVATTVTRTFVLYTSEDSSFRGVLAGSFVVMDGADWTTNPLVVNCVEQCAILFGGSFADYQCSTTLASINRRAFVDGWGDSQYCTNPATDTFKLGGPGYDCGSTGCSYSAYVSDHGCSGVNYCFR
jgi:hypothetical protein